MPKSTRITSRRAKVIEHKLLRQIIFFGVLTVTLVIVFVTFIIPNVIKLVAGSSSNQVVSQADILLPQVPTISTPVEATNSAQLTLSGYSEKGSQVVVLNNGQEIKRADAQEDGSFSVGLDLQAGENSLTTYAIKTSNQLQSAVSASFLVVFDSEMPQLEITDPQENQSILGSKNKMMTVNGITDPGAKVTLNDRFIIVKSDGSFTAVLQLNAGENVLSFRSVDPAGNVTERKITVQFSL